jgi:hypothetical protein
MFGWRSARRCGRVRAALSVTGLAVGIRCRERAHIADMHLDVFGVYWLRLGHRDLQHAVPGRRFDGVRPDVGGQGD